MRTSAQYSTSEQLEELRKSLQSADLYLDLSKLDTVSALLFARTANSRGLYDAADFILRQVDSGRTNITLFW